MPSQNLLAALLSIALCGLVPCRAFAGSPHHFKSTGKLPIHIEAQDSSGLKIATATSPTLAALVLNREFQPGDRILLSGPHQIAVRMDESLSECLLYLPGSSFSFEIPYGRTEQQTGSAYAPESFSGNSHRITARALTREERSGYRNLALNPCDLLKPEDGPAQSYPHSSTNSYSRNLYDFAARNAIDGVSQNGHHGTWPYQSWGPGLSLDLWWKLDFGRPVELDKLRLMVRADFPHDSYWKSAVIEFSDGTSLPIQITSSPDFQEFSFPKRTVSGFRLTNLLPADPAKWCAFIEVEAWGHDLP